MPIIGDELQQNKVGNFSYSATKLEKLGATEYTLVTIVTDSSGSVFSFKSDLENALKESFESCRFSPRVDNLMLRHVSFNDNVTENIGFTLFNSIDSSRFNNCLSPMGATSLNDAVVDAVIATDSYSEKLADSDYNVNGLIIVITDGAENASTATEKMVKKAINDARQREKLESLSLVIVGVNIDDKSISDNLNQWIDRCGLDIKTDYIELKNANKKTLAKLAKFISKSISASSQALNSGGPSKQLTSGALQQSLTI